MNEQLSVSIIIPIYNKEEYLSECIDSVINQSYANLEIILVDDGSTDSCAEICDAYAKADNRITVIHKKNAGLASSRNAGLKIIKGDFFAFVDADDYILPDFVEKLVELAVKDKSDIVACDYLCADGGVTRVFYKSKQKLSSKKVLNDFLYRKIEFGSTCTKLYNSKLRFIQNENIIMYEDQLFTIDCLMNSEYISVIPEGMYYYRYNKNGIMHNTTESSKYFLALKTANEKYKQHLSDSLIAAPMRCLIVSYAFFSMLGIIKCNGTSDEISYCKDIIKKYRHTVLFDRKASVKTRLACLLSYFGNNTIAIVYKAYKHARR